jgi:multiple sugar transport system substrate-binding protein
MALLKRNKLIALLFVIMMALSAFLTGCSGTGPANGSDQSKNTDNGGSKSSGKVTVSLWWQSMEDYNTKWWKKEVDNYNKSQDKVQVKIDFVPADAWEQKMKAAQAAGTAPDLLSVNYNKIAFSAAQGTIKPLDDLLDPKAFTDLQDNVNDFVTVKGKHYAYPMLAEPSSVLYYNKDMFKAAGLDPEKPPVTWDELIADGKKLSKNRVYGLLLAGAEPEIAWSQWGLQNMVHGFPITNDWSKADINNDGFKQLLTFLGTLSKDNIIPKQEPSGYTDIKSFAEGRAAMAINGSWAIGQLKNDYPKMLDKVGVAVLPTPDGNQEKPTATLGGWTLAIDGNSKHDKEAADFISYVLAGDPAIMADFFKASGYSKFAARKSVDEQINQDPVAANDPWRKMIAEKVVPYAVAEPLYDWGISIAYAKAVERVQLKGESVDKSLAEAEKEINDIITKNKLAGTNPKQ